ncbi:hypothetical protein [uncultured Pontibacter sp.]|uniref:hypothetical protein n=1 Tax=uncultured Pontibacter sp. TaxID=453356 RepID=UPI002616F221|nr:hypothetical protein [uncultured Pontibacter sp.]
MARKISVGVNFGIFHFFFSRFGKYCPQLGQRFLWGTSFPQCGQVIIGIPVASW